MRHWSKNKQGPAVGEESVRNLCRVQVTLLGRTPRLGLPVSPLHRRGECRLLQLYCRDHTEYNILHAAQYTQENGSPLLTHSGGGGDRIIQI